MGVKGLLTWIKDKHPDVVTSYTRRWAAPEIKGKRVAIDATLLTNRFHFAVRGNKVDTRGKFTLRGWYALISEMNASGVQPVAIWDERGERPWKAPEAKRRLETRATAFARKLHEDRRALRLTRLRRELLRFQQLTELEQEAVRLWWKDLNGEGESDTAVVVASVADAVQSNEFSSAPLATMEDAVEPTQPTVDTPYSSEMPATADDVVDAVESALTADVPLPNLVVTPSPPSELPSPADVARISTTPQFILTAYIVSRLAGHLKRLGWLMDSYTADSGEGSGPAYTLFEVFEAEEEEVWRIAREANGEDAAPSTLHVSEHAKVWTDDSPEIAAALDARLRALEPASTYGETPRQKALSDAEAEVYETALGDHPEMAGTPEVAVSAALEQLDDVRKAAPSVRDTYISGLMMPLESDHAACRDLLQRMGVPVLFANIPYEAEGYAAALALRGTVDFAGSEDSDVIAYGAPLLRNLSSPTSPLVCIDSAALPAQTGLSEDAFREFCIMLGTDASPRIPGIGPVSAFTYMAKHGTIEAVLSDEKVRNRIAKLRREDDGSPVADSEVEAFMETISNSRKLFDLLPPTPEVIEIPPGQSDTEVRAWLAQTHGVYIAQPGEAPHVEAEAAQAQADEMSEYDTEERDGGLWDEQWDVPHDRRWDQSKEVEQWTTLPQKPPVAVPPFPPFPSR